MITIIDYRSGNIRSIVNGFKKLNQNVEITNDAEKIASAKYLVLPGVGAFGQAMKNLEPFREVICEHILEDKPFLGICLGMHVLMSKSAESLNTKGLGIFKGNVSKIPKGRKIPHMGWNNIEIKNKSYILENISSKYFYFVHSYHVLPEEKEIINSTCDYGINIVSSISRNNLFATQFHPEKSSKQGLKILKNFINLTV